MLLYEGKIEGGRESRNTSSRPAEATKEWTSSEKEKELRGKGSTVLTGSARARKIRYKRTKASVI